MRTCKPKRLGGRGSSSGVNRGETKGASSVSSKLSKAEIHSSNLKVVQRLVEKHPDLLHYALIEYNATSKRRVEMYELIDRLYKHNPEGYSYSIRTRMERNHTTQESREVKFIQLEKVYHTEKMRAVNGRWQKVSERHKGSLTGYGNQPSISYDIVSSRSAIRGYAKAQLYRAAGKIYDPS